MIPIRQLGEVGLVTDVPPQDLPINAFSAANNVLFRDGRAIKSLGDSLITYFTAGAASCWFETWQYQVGTYKQAICFTDGTIQVWDGSAASTPSIRDQAGAVTVLSASDEWQSTVFGKFCVLNNRTNIPLYSWNSATLSSDGSRFQMIPGWGAAGSPTGAVQSIRSHRNFLIAVGVAAAPYTIYWSDAAAVDSFPTSWDYTSTTNLAGYVIVAASDGALVDSCEMGDMLVVYTQYAAFALQYIEGTDVFALRRLLPYGLINRECAVQFNGRHFCVGDSMVYVHDGFNVERVAERKVEQRLFAEINTRELAHVVASPERGEIWVYYSSSGATIQNRALIWNYERNTWQFVDLPGYARIAPSVEIAAPQTIGALTGTIGALSGTIGDWNKTGAQRQLMAITGLGHPSVDTGLLRLNATRQKGGANYYAYVERTGLDLDEVKQNAYRSMHLRCLTPQLRGSGTVDVQVGTQRSPSDEVSWGATKTFTIDGSSGEYKVDIRKTGRYLAYRVGSWAGTPRSGYWELTGVDLDVVDGGR